MTEHSTQVPKKNAPFVSLRKRGKGGDELDDYVCPMDLEVPVALQSYVTQQRSRRSTDRSNEEYRERSRHSREEVNVTSHTRTRDATRMEL